MTKLYLFRFLKYKFMKKMLILGFSLLLVVVSCKTAPKPILYDVKGKVSQLDQHQAYLTTFDRNLKRKVLDTILIQDSLFIFKVPQQNPSIAIVSFEGSKLQIPIIIGDGDINMIVNEKNPFDSNLVKTTSKLTQKFYLYEKNIQKDKQKGQKMIQAYQMTNSQAEKDSIRHAFENWKDSAKRNQYTFIKNNKDIVGLIVMQSLINDPNSDFQKIKSAFESYPINVQRSELGKNIHTVLLTKGATEIGGRAPNFSGTTPEGTKISLSQAMGKVTIIDFWASWCRPCRIENPYLVQLYKKYHDQGLNIISISLDKDKAAWLNAIEKDSLTWPQVSELKYWQEPIAKIYGVVSIPQTYILDSQGIIRAKNLRRENLEKKIKELLND